MIDDLIEIRTSSIDPNISDKWYWPKQDHGAWYGPILNWNTLHKDTYFKHIKKYDIVVTAGANCGLHTRVFGNRFKNVYAFEPDYLNFYCLTKNCPENNIYKFQAALGQFSGTCHLNTDDKTNMGAYNIEKNVEGNHPIISIDNLNLPTCDFIQLDVEGYEYEVLLGAIETITKYKPVISIETMECKTKLFLEKFNYILDETILNGDKIFYHDNKTNN